MRNLYIRPTGEFELHSNQILKVLRPLSGLTYACDYWADTIRRHFENDIGMTAVTGEVALFFKINTWRTGRYDLLLR
jgi:hypothetical protein